jgi:hypothetical protein
MGGLAEIWRIWDNEVGQKMRFKWLMDRDVMRNLQLKI